MYVCINILVKYKQLRIMFIRMCGYVFIASL